MSRDISTFGIPNQPALAVAVICVAMMVARILTSLIHAKREGARIFFFFLHDEGEGVGAGKTGDFCMVFDRSQTRIAALNSFYIWLLYTSPSPRD